MGDRLAKRGVIADLYIFGGAAMALAYDARRSTRDIDAVFQPHGVVLDEARAVADELGLPHWWLNEQASAYVAPGGGARRRDAEDIRFLIDHLGLTSAEQALDLCAEIFPEEEVPGRARLVLDDVFGAD
ncbi:hypothetical protein IRY44_22800 [Micromonospora sp. ANENR4]|uniref:DUF6036 family nucleotidyltransferase n=1 Tax=Micromonospora sp. ANENR4 TaxID=2783662 RepID=UPI00188E1166|nr:DUF6036 family nucleotidyltransferase [Micromonospora sp. ANENR4]MBF5032588.1 hypothetical protein [Micromonospora sp. ANENR4]